MERRKKAEGVLKIIYIVLMAFLLLWYLYNLATMSSFKTPDWIQVLRCIAAALAIYTGKLWKDKGFLALLAFWVLLVARVWFFGNTERLMNSSVQGTLLNGVWLFGACYGLGRVLSLKELKRFTAVIGGIWTAGMTVFAAVGIYAAWTDQVIYTIGGNKSWAIQDGRLKLLFQYNLSANTLCVSALIALCCMLGCEKKWIRIPGTFAILVMVLAICLTDSRTEKICFALGSSGMISLLLIHSLLRRKNGIRIWLTGACCFLLLIGVQILLFSQVNNLFNQAKLSGGLLMPKAFAEEAEAAETEATMIVHRWTNSGGSILTEREVIWQAVIEALWANPKHLFFGASVYKPMTEPNVILGYNFAHCHNLPLQILLVSGIPGVLLTGCFFVITVRRGIRLMGRTEPEMRGLNLLPAAVFALFIGELVECFIILHNTYSPQQSIVFIAIGVVCAYGRTAMEER